MLAEECFWRLEVIAQARGLHSITELLEALELEDQGALRSPGEEVRREDPEGHPPVKET